jgi:hypothetical protein
MYKREANIVGMQATTGIQVTIVTPAASNSKDDSNSMTNHKTEIQAVAGMKAQQDRDTVNIRDDSSCRDDGNIMDVNSIRTDKIRQ